MPRAIHQLLPVFSYGDAIGGAVRRTRTMLERLGHRSQIFADLVDPRLGDLGRPAAELAGELQPGDAVLYHLSIGSRLAGLALRLGAPLVVDYHNITPTAYYAGVSAEVALRLDQGRRDLARLSPAAELVIAPSEYNLVEARAAGARRTAVVPPGVDRARLRPRAAVPARPPVILSVGRIAPNKRLDRLIRALAVLRATDLPAARLHICGSADDTAGLLATLRRLARSLGVDAAVSLPGTRAADAAVGDAYAAASVLAVASEHEGFCVPLLEAMAFEVPVVASAAGAIPDTLGGAGIVLTDDDPMVWSAAIARAASDPSLRAELVGRGRRRLADFSDAAVEGRLSAALAAAGLHP